MKSWLFFITGWMCFFSVVPTYAELPINETAASIEDPAFRDRMDFAAGLYARQMYEMAAAEYRDIVERFGSAGGVDEAYFGLAESLYLAGKYPEALEAFQSFYNRYLSHSKTQKAKLRISESLFYAGDYDSAREAFESLLTSADAWLVSAAHYYLGKIDYEAGAFESAEQHFTKASESPENNAFKDYARYYLGEIAMTRQNYTSARGYFKPLLENSSKEIQQLGLRALGKIAFLEKDYEQAASYFEKTIEKFPEGSSTQEAVVNLLKALLNHQQFEKVVAAYKERSLFLKEYPFITEAGLSAAEALTQLTRYEESSNLIETLLAKSEMPADDRDRLLFKKAENAIFLSDPEEALSVIESIEKSENLPRDRILFMKAEALREAGRSAEAAMVYEQIRTSMPDSALTHEALAGEAYALYASGKLEEALARMQLFIQEYEGHDLAPKVLFDSIAIQIKQKMWKEAIAASEGFLLKFPNDEQTEYALYRLASLYTETGNYAKAIDLYRQYLDQYGDQRRPEIYFLLAYNLQLNGNLEEAIGTYDRLNVHRVPQEIAYAASKNKAAAHMQMENYAEAAETYLNLLKEFPQNDLGVEIYFWMMDFFADQQNGPVLRQTVNIFKQQPQAQRHQPAQEFYLAESYRIEGKAQDAIPYYEKVISAEAEYQADAYRGLGLSYQSFGNKEQAMTAFEQGLRLAGSDHQLAMELRMDIAGLYAQAEQALDAAKAYFAVAILYDDPQMAPQALWHAGQWFEKAGKTAESRQAYRELQERFPSHEYAGAAKEKNREVAA